MNKKSSVFVTLILPLLATATISEANTASIHGKVKSAVPWFQLASFSAIVVNNGLQAALALKKLGKADKSDE